MQSYCTFSSTEPVPPQADEEKATEKPHTELAPLWPDLGDPLPEPAEWAPRVRWHCAHALFFLCCFALAVTDRIVGPIPKRQPSDYFDDEKTIDGEAEWRDTPVEGDEDFAEWAAAVPRRCLCFVALMTTFLMPGVLLMVYVVDRVVWWVVANA